jgi:hypothetical protein
MTNTITRFALFPFTHKGFDFVSHVEIESDVYPQIINLPEGMFINMNKGMIDDLLTITETTTREEILSQLDHINENGSYAFLKLDGDE